MSNFLFVLNQLIVDFIKKSPNRNFAKTALWVYSTFEHCYNHVVLRFDTPKDLCNALKNNGVTIICYYGNYCYLKKVNWTVNTQRIVCGVWDITFFLDQCWPPLIRDSLYDVLRLFLKLGGVIIYRNKLVTTREQLYKINQNIKLTYYPRNKLNMRKITKIRFKI